MFSVGKITVVSNNQPQLAKIEILDSNPRIKAAVAGKDVELTGSAEEIGKLVEHVPKTERESIKEYAEIPRPMMTPDQSC